MKIGLQHTMAQLNEKQEIKFELSESEYISLRDEIIQRIILMNSQATNAITVVLTMWAAGLGLFGIQLANLDSFNKLHNLALCFGEVGSFFCAVLILIPMALKSGENLRQQVAISTYIRLFYYDFVRKKRIKSKYIYPWEYMSESTNDIYEKNKRNKVLLSMANAEYPILGLVSVVFSCCVLLANCNFICVTQRDYIAFILMAGGIEIVEIIIIVFLYKTTSIKENMTGIAEDKLKKYIKFARKIKI